MEQKRIPISTYRLQLNPAFGFDEARRLLAYLSELGIDTVYASPIFRARPGSTHGYDIVDPNEINPALGTRKALDRLFEALEKRGMGWIQDISPNHMAFHQDSCMLMDVLRQGKNSIFRDYFDIDWDHPDPLLKGRVMAPFLEKPYEECIKAGDFRLRMGATGLYITYGRHAFPLRVADYETVLRQALGESPHASEREAGGSGERQVDAPAQPYGEFTAALLRSAAWLSAMACENRALGTGRIDRSIDAMYEVYSLKADFRSYVDERLAAVKGEEMDRILWKQIFRPMCWKETAVTVNYRRFFDVNSLICLATQRSGVYHNTHLLVENLIRSGKVTGLRIDHIDGLRDPGTYLLWLRERFGEIYMVAEKILSDGEHLRWWSVDGTTGYDFLNVVNGLFCRRENAGAFDSLYHDFTGVADDPTDLLHEKKKLVMNSNLRPDLDNLTRWLMEALEHTAWREVVEEIPRWEYLREALVEMLAELTVYRTYLSPTDQSWHDGVPLAGALGRAEKRNPHLADEFRLLAAVLMAAPRMAGREGARTGSMPFTMTLQQYMGAVTAKGFEDTFLYVYNRLISLNEVGGEPRKFGTTPADLHALNLSRAASHPHSMNASSTHDAKRGEDVRARINVLSEIPGEWESRIKRWAGMNASRKTRRNGEDMPDRNDEYFLYQTLIGSLPFDPFDLVAYRHRISRYVRKTAREAKVHTRWRDPDTSYEDAFVGFVESILTPGLGNDFFPDFLAFQKRIARCGAVNSLAQTLIKICAPGVPDFYQGSEVWDLNLVDPDNRRPVDFASRMCMLDDLIGGFERDPVGTCERCLGDISGGAVKMLLIYRALAVRRANPYLFGKGTYFELGTEGDLAANVIAFARGAEGSYAVCIIPRFMAGLLPDDKLVLDRVVWGDTVVRVPPGAPRRWTDAITGERILGTGGISVGNALRHFPVALLMEERE